MTIRTAVRWCVVGLYLVLITALSLMPSRDLGRISLPPGTDKLVHACMYAGFVFLSAWALWERSPTRAGWLVLTAGVAFGYGLLMELAQGVMGLGRASSAFDMLANAVGAALGALAWRVWAGAADRRKVEG